MTPPQVQQEAGSMTCPHCGRDLVFAHDPLTPQQFRVLVYLDTQIRETGSAPSYAEIADHFNFASLATVHEHLDNLEKKGVIVRAFNTPRGITVLVRPDDIDSRRVGMGRPKGSTNRDVTRPVRWVKP